MNETSNGINRDGPPISSARRPDLRVPERDPAVAEKATVLALRESFSLTDNQRLFRRDKKDHFYISRARQVKDQPGPLVNAVLDDRFKEVYKAALGSDDVIRKGRDTLQAEIVSERDRLRTLRKDYKRQARLKYAPHSRRDKALAEADFQQAWQNDGHLAREEELKKQELIIKSMAGRSQAVSERSQREKTVAEYKKFFKTDQNPSASQLSNFIYEQRIREKALGSQPEDLERQRRASEILTNIARRKDSVTRGLELRLRSLGFELGRIIDSIRRRPGQALAAAIVTAVAVGTLAFAATRPTLPSEIAEAIHQLRTQGIVMRSATPEPLPTFIPAKPTEAPAKPTEIPVKPTEAPAKPTEPPKIAEAKPTAIPPTPTREPTSTAVPTRTAIPASPTAVPTREPSPSATRPPATATREPQPTAVPTQIETTGVALAEADKKTREAVIAATEAYPGIEGVRRLEIPKVEDINPDKLVFGSRHPVNIIEFDYNWVNATRTDAERAKYYDVYAKGVIAGLKQVYNPDSYLTVILEPGHQSYYGKDNRGNVDTGSGYTLDNGKTAIEKKYNLETAKAISKIMAKECPNWTIVVTVDDKGYEVKPLASFVEKKGVVDNVDAFFPMRFAEDELSRVAKDNVVRLALHYNGYAGSDFQRERKNPETGQMEMETVLRDQAANRRGGSVIPSVQGGFMVESGKLAEILAVSLQQAVREVDSSYSASVYQGDDAKDPYLITEGREDQPDVLASALKSGNNSVLSNKFNRRLVLADQPGGFFYDKKHNQPVKLASVRP